MSVTSGIPISQVAERLKISRQAVRKLIESGRLDKAGSTSYITLIDPSSLERHLATGTIRSGRPWEPRIAWAAIGLLSHSPFDDLNSSEISRLKRRLKTLDALHIHDLARRRAVVRRYQASTDAIPVLQSHLIATGGSAMRDEVMADIFGLSGGGGTFEGYAMSGDADRLAANLGMREQATGNVVIREVESKTPFGDGRAPLAAVAFDLMDSLATRERSAGLQVLKKLIDV